jgi:hypothetical protein
VGEVEILGWIIPGARKAAAFPESNYSELVALVGLSRLHPLLHCPILTSSAGNYK